MSRSRRTRTRTGEVGFRAGPGVGENARVFLGVCTVVKHNKTNPLKPNLPQTPEQLLSPYAYTPSAVYPPSTHTVRCRDGTCHDIVLQRVKLGELIGCPYRILDDADPAPLRARRPATTARTRTPAATATTAA